jgi:hypothetical protein
LNTTVFSVVLFFAYVNYLGDPVSQNQNAKRKTRSNRIDSKKN